MNEPKLTMQDFGVQQTDGRLRTFNFFYRDTVLYCRPSYFSRFLDCTVLIGRVEKRSHTNGFVPRMEVPTTRRDWRTIIDLPFWLSVYTLHLLLFHIICWRYALEKNRCLEFMSFMLVLSIITAVLAIYANHYRTERLVSRYAASSIVLTFVHAICTFIEIDAEAALESSTLINLNWRNACNRMSEFFLLLSHIWITHYALSLPIEPPPLHS